MTCNIASGQQHQRRFAVIQNRHNDDLRRFAPQHELLGPRQHDPVAIGVRGRGNVGQIPIAMRLRQRKRTDSTFGQLGQPLGLLRFGPADNQSLRRQRRCNKRRCQQIAPHLLDQRHHFGQRQAHAAIAFRYRHRSPAESCNLRPHTGIITGFAVDQLADFVDRRFVTAECRCHIEQFDLLFAIAKACKLHVSLPVVATGL